MFVIVQCLDNLTKQQVYSLSIPEQIAVTMKHAGVAITVTSLTDVCAFGVGAVTVCI
jgi:Niemann-Pick C1 protein